MRFIIAKANFLRRNRYTFDIPYPLAMGYSDILIVHKNIMHELFHKLGVFSAMNLFVEIALPTAIVLTTPRSEVTFLGNIKDTHTNVMWDVEKKESFGNERDYNYKKLIELWDDKCLYAHPVKLSKWKV